MMLANGCRGRGTICTGENVLSADFQPRGISPRAGVAIHPPCSRSVGAPEDLRHRARRRSFAYATTIFRNSFVYLFKPSRRPDVAIPLF